MKSKASYFSFLLLLLSATATAQTVSLTFRGETLSEALRQIDHAQDERRILFLFDDLEMYTVTTVIDRLPAAEAVRKVCRNFPVSITEVGSDIFVEYEPATVHLRPVVVDGRRVPLPALLLADDVPDSLATIQQLARHIVYFNRVCPQEKVYLHLDNTAYFQGETIWYAANVVSASSGGASASRILYVELLSPTGVILQQQKLKVIDGRCHGSFPLVDSSVKAAVDLRGVVAYPSGYYQIRAYTRAQLNFDEAAIFSRVIPVYRAPETEGHYENPVITDYDGQERNRPELPRSERPAALNVAFFPEGGHRIEDVPCRIAFKITDENGMGMEVDAVCDDSDHIIPVTIHKGMGAFDYVPGRGMDRITFIKDGKRHTFALPKAEATGCTVQVDALADDTVRISIDGRNLPKKTLPLGYTITTAGHVAACDAVLLTAATTKDAVTSCQARLGFPKKNMPTGVYQFTLFNHDGAILAQRLFFIDNGIVTIPVTVQSDKEAIQPFEEIRLNLQASKGDLTFSLAVRDAADYGTAYRDDIRTYLLLSSELKGLIEDPGWYFQGQQVNESTSLQADADHSEPVDSRTRRLVEPRQEALDLLMLVQGWTRYDWQQMAGVESFKVRHYTEGQLVIDGWAFSRILEKPLKNTKITIHLYSPDRKFTQKTTVTTDSLGYWSVGLDDFEGDWDLFISSEQTSWLGKNATTRIRLERSSRPEVQPFRPEDIFLPDYTNQYPTIFSWQKDDKPKVQFFPEPDFNSPHTYQLEEVVIEGKRRYIDYNRFLAFDADKDTEFDLDEGNYTHDLAGYLESKGYSLMFNYGDMHETSPGTFKTSSIARVDIDSHRTLWTMNFPDSSRRDARTYNEFRRAVRWDREGDPRNHVPSGIYNNFWISEGVGTSSSGSWASNGFAWNLDMEYVQSVLVFGYEPSHRYVEVVINMKSIDQFRQKTKNFRHTTFTGYTPVADFYAPRYPKGPIEGDKDYRRTLYWNPSVTTDADGRATVSFYNNGYSRALTVSAQGLTPDGIPIIENRQRLGNGQ